MQQTIPKLLSLIFWKSIWFWDRKMIKETTTKNCKNCLNWSKKIVEIQIRSFGIGCWSGEQDTKNNNINFRPRRSGSTVPPTGARYSAMGGGGMHSPQQTPSLLMPSPTPTSAQQLLSQQVIKDVFYPAMFCFGLSPKKSFKANVLFISYSTPRNFRRTSTFSLNLIVYLIWLFFAVSKKRRNSCGIFFF